MTEHNLKELERQYLAAEGRFNAARDARQSAFSRLQEARLVATGFAGRMVRGRRWETGPEYTFLAEKITGYKNDRITGRIIKKDGTLGERKAEVEIVNLVDVGEYTP